MVLGKGYSIKNGFRKRLFYKKMVLGKGYSIKNGFRKRLFYKKMVLGKGYSKRTTLLTSDSLVISRPE